MDGHEVSSDKGEVVIIDRENKGCVNRCVDQSQKISHPLNDLSQSATGGEMLQGDLLFERPCCILPVGDHTSALYLSLTCWGNIYLRTDKPDAFQGFNES